MSGYGVPRADGPEEKVEGPWTVEHDEDPELGNTAFLYCGNRLVVEEWGPDADMERDPQAIADAMNRAWLQRGGSE